MASSIEAVNNDAELVALFAHTELSYAVSGFGQRFGKFGCWFEFIGGGIKTENWKLSREMLGLDFRLQWKPARAGFPQWHKSPESGARMEWPWQNRGRPREAVPTQPSEDTMLQCKATYPRLTPPNLSHLSCLTHVTGFSMLIAY
ncbi:hypothetical protein HZ326_4901 [Fusarium oxysporum f. sp. albedinis]|nr:hypothetical protein HZ326_4901 [Fusarium oxysporum f. sp. albedinis]